MYDFGVIAGKNIIARRHSSIGGNNAVIRTGNSNTSPANTQQISSSPSEIDFTSFKHGNRVDLPSIVVIRRPICVLNRHDESASRIEEKLQKCGRKKTNLSLECPNPVPLLSSLSFFSSQYKTTPLGIL